MKSKIKKNQHFFFNSTFGFYALFLPSLFTISSSCSSKEIGHLQDFRERYGGHYAILCERDLKYIEKGVGRIKILDDGIVIFFENKKFARIFDDTKKIEKILSREDLSEGGSVNVLSSGWLIENRKCTSVRDSAYFVDFLEEK